MSDITPVIHWFRRDLRLSDNIGLEAASKSGFPILPVFIFDPRIIESDKISAPRLAFMLKALEALDHDLQKRGSRLFLFYGDPLKVLRQLIQYTQAQGLYFNNDYTPFAQKRDTKVTSEIAVPIHNFDDALLLPPGSVMNKKGKPFSVFTPFKKRWLVEEKPEPVKTPPGKCFIKADAFTEMKFLDRKNNTTHYYEYVPTLKELGIKAQIFELPKAGEKAAQKRLDNFLDKRIYQYSTGRNEMAAKTRDDTLTGSSFLSPYFRFGMLSPRQAYWKSKERYKDVAEGAGWKGKRESVDIWISELVWREFYMHILYHFPHVTKENFRTQYDDLKWRHSKKDLDAWKAGMTGYPIVDAAMRQLQQMGWMPNRARMIVASFLTKDLLIDWREGERHFMDWLIDGDPAANNGGWQWSAGTGTDAQPFFRIFNPVIQSRRFDPEGIYIRRWITELEHVSNKFIHAPWTMNQPPLDYPAPIVDHKMARQETLAAFRSRKTTKTE